MTTKPAKTDLDWRPLAEADLGDVDRIAAAAHTGLDERPAVFAEKLRLYPRGCLALDGPGGVLGYAFSHPWTLGDAPGLDAFLGALPASPDCLYLHDLALSKSARGRGAAGAAIARLAAIAAAEALAAMALVSVHGTGPYWAHAGFADERHPGLAAKLAAYGESARYMTRRLGAGG
ncbi:acetyltransferase (GNAT) family protein [Roseiarcus fermentans]|uniref:Acetyltransferase (GNAT) family protein n=1 Tax=Roseiarcus fermentans TaxID=1473586 RepID=A0A366FC46_9HYPH|nr:GNAT family N-acetyltransferase [Roseiarcus fermentans]RBP12242.1 acetyltransferase (GNAT) family protein [Roseiarcus fermentans]